jgi:hypothetical protein
MPQGRPTTYTPELAAYVCEMIATHTCGLKKLTKMYEKFPSQSTLYAWMTYEPSFSGQYFEAKRLQANYLADSLLDMPDDLPTYIDEKGVERIDPGMLGREKLRYQINVWHASKLAPKVYGDKKQEETNTADTLSKIKSLVDDLNKINSSDI